MCRVSLGEEEDVGASEEGGEGGEEEEDEEGEMEGKLRTARTAVYYMGGNGGGGGGGGRGGARGANLEDDGEDYRFCCLKISCFPFENLYFAPDLFFAAAFSISL